MLQQTTVASVIPRFTAWMRRFPTVGRLARASEREVLRAWEGLGYYSRARNLLRSAREIVGRHRGRLPDTYDALRGLPGIGPYTASAILSIAFNKSYPVIDANVKRVMARLMDVKSTTKNFDDVIGRELKKAIPDDRPGDFNEALMELGQTVCTGSDPSCGRCPLSPRCGALKAGTVNTVLGRRKREVRRLRTRVLILVNRGRVLLRRSESGPMKSLWRFPGIPLDRPVGAFFKKTGIVNVREIAVLPGVTHYYTMYAEELHPVIIRVRGETTDPEGGRWIRLDGLNRLPVPSVYRRIIGGFPVPFPSTGK